VPAIFGSEVFPSPVLEQIGREAGVKYVDVLRDDDLPGAPGDPEHSWMGLMHFELRHDDRGDGAATPARSRRSSPVTVRARPRRTTRSESGDAGAGNARRNDRG